MPQRPNIVYITTDGHRADAVGYLGNRVVQTPHIDRLAREGIAFRQAYASNPICTASRASVFTGVHPLVHQVTCHQNRVPPNLPQLSELFAEAGYYTAVIGHYELVRNLSRGWHEQIDEAQRATQLRPAYDRWQQSGRIDRGWDHGRLEGPPEAAHANLITDRARIMLDTAEAAGQPFFFHVSYNDPHPPYFTPEPFDQQIDPANVALPPRNDGPDQPAWQKQVAADFADRPPTDDELRNLVATYYGMIGHADHQIGRLIDDLRQRGLLANTWIIHASDHGDFCGDKGLFSHTESLYECLLRVPLAIRPPDEGDQPRGQLLDGFVELVDLFPTMLGIADIATPDYAQGHDLMHWARRGAKQPLRERIFAQVGDYHGGLGSTLRGGRPKSARHPGLLESVRDHSFNYIRDPDFGDEAYDLQADPHELHNLLQSGSANADRVDEARRQIDANHAACVALREQIGVVPGDRGFYPDGWE